MEIRQANKIQTWPALSDFNASVAFDVNPKLFFFELMSERLSNLSILSYELPNITS